ncbi:MAG: class I SAM-dependent methyltransferase [Methanomicrobiales archaeon]|nr:class I SAM-dependent methyltransferase [Methanomicrobiales archaeon]
MEKRIDSDDYRDYVIKGGMFIGAFEEMYRRVEDPWNIGDAREIQYDLLLYLIARHRICHGGGRILDIGCGRGAFTARLKGLLPDAEILAVDISPTAVRKAEKSYPIPGISFSVLDIQAEYTRLRREYDLVVISQMVWYILPRLKVIMEHVLTHVLKEGGYLLVNQAFYRPEDQSYGKEMLSTVEDLVRIIGRDPVELIETNRLSNHNAILLFRG